MNKDKSYGNIISTQELKAHLQDNNKARIYEARIYEEKKKQNKQKKIIADRYTTIQTLKPIKDCKSCDFHNNYTCFDHEDEQIKEVYPNVHYTDDLEWVVYE